ncbi:endonuclease/exonuclease/phosphatase family protein [Mucilaginibacter sp. OK283]|jgi:endonuclease/exonuclease/phosphatase family metal-dependent hydrolase|uniref:endonuclease/exonuclease/phosphatase family protein n=1 Tax=Mucilaginibacter sp. OK283 TaxID=1881049 RepID=UPI0008BA3A62|nr:endonuclease/exonuclease/phosphatase family protein [Mucilaginibacter sp. OK283]SEP38467.1 Metal-dependent hydrolase, endonuclease/exonuclease/phosphatase family [Mucilaginibacter sp. OK283]
MKKLLFILLFAICASACFAQRFTVATYNLRNDSPTNDDSVRGNGWKQRLPVVAKLIQFHDFDIFGTQEGLVHQLHDLTKAMPGYNYTGIGRDDGKTAGEFSAIFYKTNKFKLLKHGDFWLSTITNRPNKGWDAALPRICSWASFREIKTGYKFYYFNLHMDHIGVVARRESAKLVLQKIKQMTANQPVILSGDFNVDETSDSYAIINTSGKLKDAYELSPIKYAGTGTFNAFDAENKSKGRIDHIFLSKDFSVKRYGILTDTYRALNQQTNKYETKLPSDHFPVMIMVDHK